MWHLNTKIGALAQSLQMLNMHSLVVTGSCNSRIIRTTIKDSYQTTQPTLYIIGLSFLGRTEIPVNAEVDQFEGSWMSIQNQPPPNVNYCVSWHNSDSDTFIRLKLKSEVFSVADRLEDLMFRLLAMINDLKSRGHQVCIFRQADDVYHNLLNDSKFALLNQPEIVQGLKWGALEYQYKNGAKFDPRDSHLETNIRHVLSDNTNSLIKFITDYISKRDSA